MPTDTKQLTVSEVMDWLDKLPEFSEKHDEEWRNEVARDLQHIVSYARWSFAKADGGHLAVVFFCAAVLRIVERVAEFEKIERKGNQVSDNNRIQMPGKQPESEQPVNIGLGHGNGVVEMQFNPPITRMRLKPREARALAVSMLLHADQAEYPDLKIEP